MTAKVAGWTALSRIAQRLRESLQEEQAARIACLSNCLGHYIAVVSSHVMELVQSLGKTYGVDLGARPVNGDRPQHSWLLEMDNLASEHRPNAPTGPPKLPRDEPENRPGAPRT